MKSLIVFILLSFFIASGLTAQSKQYDFFTIGYSDAVNRKTFDSKYSIENLKDKISEYSDNEKAIYAKNAECYNLGYIYGLSKLSEFKYDSDFLDFAYVQKNLANVGKVVINEADYQWNTSLGTVLATSKDGSVANLEIYFGFKKGDEDTNKAISTKALDIKGLIRKFLNSKTDAELKDTANDASYAIEIKNTINEKLGAAGNIQVIMFKYKAIQ